MTFCYLYSHPLLVFKIDYCEKRASVKGTLHGSRGLKCYGLHHCASLIAFRQEQDCTCWIHHTDSINNGPHRMLFQNIMPPAEPLGGPLAAVLQCWLTCAHTLCCSHQGFHKKPGARASHKAARVNYYVDGCSAHKGKGVHLFLPSLLIIVHSCWMVFYFLCVQLAWFEEVEGAYFTETVLNCRCKWYRPEVFNTAPGDSLPCRV